jgi:hypothetical protein
MINIIIFQLGKRSKNDVLPFWQLAKLWLKQLPEKENSKIQVLLTSPCTNVNIHQNNSMPFFSFI